MPDMKHDHISNEGESSGAPAEIRPKPPRRILLVDDELEVLNLNADVLLRAGYLVDTAENGASGWKALKASRYDVLITDNSMPGVTGLELIKKARSEDMTLPVIMASGTVPTEELIQNPCLHVDAMLPKPYTITELVKTVGKVLHKSGTARK